MFKSAIVCVCFVHRVQQLEEENDEMKLNVCRLKSQTEKLDQVRSGFDKIQILSDINRPT